MTDSYQDTIVAPATVPGTGAISIIRLSGPRSLSIADSALRLRKGGKCSEKEGYTIHYGSIFNADGALLDDVLVSVFRAPHSYTGEDSVEISCHASSYIAQEIVTLLIGAGARMAEPGEFTRRAYLNGKMDLAQAEAVADVISSTTSAAHRVSMSQLKGGFSKELSTLRNELLDMASLLELELDFSEEEVEFASRDRLVELLQLAQNHVDKLASSFRLGNMIKNGVPVAIVGAVNAGKSTLLNALVGEDRAIVSPVEGTTRDTIEEPVNLGGTLFRFIDTAGIRDTSELVERMGIERTYLKISQARIVLAVLDCTAPESGLKAQISEILEHVNLDSQQVIIVLNKCDLLSEKALNKIVNTTNTFVLSTDNKIDIISLSAKGHFGVDKLCQMLEKSQSGLLDQSSANAVFVTNVRHFDTLTKASSALANARTSLLSGIPSDLVAEDLRTALASVNLILGTDLLSGQTIDPETILHHIFKHHCVGK